MMIFLTYKTMVSFLLFGDLILKRYKTTSRTETYIPSITEFNIKQNLDSDYKYNQSVSPHINLEIIKTAGLVIL